MNKLERVAKRPDEEYDREFISTARILTSTGFYYTTLFFMLPVLAVMGVYSAVTAGLTLLFIGAKVFGLGEVTVSAGVIGSPLSGGAAWVAVVLACVLHTFIALLVWSVSTELWAQWKLARRMRKGLR